MTIETKTFKQLGRAINYATKEDGSRWPMVEVGGVWIVGDFDDVTTEVRLLDRNGCYAGQVSLKHLARLGNANHATPGESR